MIKVVLVFMLLICSCSYSFRGSLSSHLKTIYIDDFFNKATEYRNYSTEITTQVFQAFNNDNTLRSAKKEDANLILKGNIESVTKTSSAVNVKNDQLQTDKYKLSVTISIECKDVKENKIIVKTNIQQDTFIPFSASESDIDEAIRTLLKRITELVVDNVIGAW
jgi:hypothetical protein